MRATLLTILVMFLCLSAGALQNQPACDGEFAVVRVSQINPS